MKIGIRGGHTKASPGASGYLDELTEDRKVYTKLKQLLSCECSVVDLTPPENYTYPEELNYGINSANKSSLDYGLSIHFNSCNTTEKPLGSEIWIWDNADQNTKAIAARILNKLNSSGYIDRGIQYSPSRMQLGEIMYTSMPWFIIEICFVSSKADADLYNKTGALAAATAIAEGLLGHPVESSSSKPQPQLQWQANDIGIIQQKLNRLQITDYEGKHLVIDNSLGPRTKSAIVKFEQIMGLSIDSGIWGVECENAYKAIIAKPVIKYSAAYNQVCRYVQWRTGASVDGYFGPDSCRHLKFWQDSHGLVPDASCGPLTWEKLIFYNPC